MGRPPVLRPQLRRDSLDGPAPDFPMAIRDWSARDIKRWWLRGLVAEGLLVAVPLGIALFGQRPHASPSPYPWFDTTLVTQHRPPDERAALLAQLERELDSLGLQMTSSGDSLLTFAFSDSETVTILSRSDTIQSIRLSPAAERAVTRELAPLAQGLGDALTDMGRRILMLLLVIYVPIPLALTGITAYWAVARPRAGAPAV